MAFVLVLFGIMNGLERIVQSFFTVLFRTGTFWGKTLATVRTVLPFLEGETGGRSMRRMARTNWVKKMDTPANGRCRSKHDA